MEWLTEVVHSKFRDSRREHHHHVCCGLSSRCCRLVGDEKLSIWYSHLTRFSYSEDIQIIAHYEVFDFVSFVHSTPDVPVGDF